MQGDIPNINSLSTSKATKQKKKKNENYDRMTDRIGNTIYKDNFMTGA